MMGNRKLSDNRGIAMVTVLVAVTVCMLIATMALEISYNAMLTRKVYNTSENNTYTSETTFDALELVMQSLAVYTAGNMQVDDDFTEKLIENLLESAGADTTNDVDVISNYLFNNLPADVQKQFAKTKLDDDGNEVYDLDANGKYQRDPSLFTIVQYRTQEDEDDLNVNGIIQNSESGLASDTKKSLSIRVQLTYTDANGYQSTITSDLVVNDVTKRKTAADYSLGSYTMFTGGGATFTGNDTSSTISYVRQDGNAYIGTMINEAPLALTVESTGVEFTGNVIINGDVKISNLGALLFTGGSGTEVSIYGTIYIDSKSDLIVHKGVDLMCKDIVIIKEDGSQYSYFGDSNGPAKFTGSGSYSAMFPFGYSSSEAFANATRAASNSTDGLLNNDFKSNQIGGAVLIGDGANAYVAKCVASGTTYKWQKKSDSSNLGDVIINKNPSFVPESLTTFWTYDNQVKLVDPELGIFVNTRLLHMFSQVPEACMNFQTSKLHSTWLDEQIEAGNVKYARQSTMTDTPLDFGGKSTDDLRYYYIKDGASWRRLTSAEILAQSLSGYSDGNTPTTYTKADGTTAAITYNGNNIVGYDLKFGKITSEGENLHSGGTSILLAAIWGAYTVQKNGGDVIGITISADKCTYKILGKYYITIHSIINAKDKADPLAIDTLLDYLKQGSNIRPKSSGFSEGFGGLSNTAIYDYAYSLLNFDNMFLGGIDAFKNGTGGGSPGSVYLEYSGQYDFITLENWTQT